MRFQNLQRQYAVVLNSLIAVVVFKLSSILQICSAPRTETPSQTNFLQFYQSFRQMKEKALRLDFKSTKIKKKQP